MSAALVKKKNAARASAGGPEKYDDQEEWVAASIVAVVRSRGAIKFLTAWQGYDHSYNTIEPRENILDKVLVRNFMADGVDGIDIHHVIHSLRVNTFNALAANTSPQAKLKVEVPLAALRPVALCLLRRFARVPSRAGKLPLTVDVKDKGGVRKHSLEIDGLQDIASALSLQLVKPDKAFGALVFNQGRSYNTDMVFGGPTLTLMYSEPIPREDGAFIADGTYKFALELNKWKVLGHNGDVEGDAGMPNATCKKPIAEHVKNILRGRKAWGLKHQLQEKWAELPPSQPVLSGADAFEPNEKRVAKRKREAPPTKAVPMGKLF